MSVKNDLPGRTKQNKLSYKRKRERDRERKETNLGEWETTIVAESWNVFVRWTWFWRLPPPFAMCALKATSQKEDRGRRTKGFLLSQNTFRSIACDVFAHFQLERKGDHCCLSWTTISIVIPLSLIGFFPLYTYFRRSRLILL